MAYRISYRRTSSFTLGPIEFLVILNFIMWVAVSINRSLFIGLFGFTPAYVLIKPWTVLTAMFIHSPFPSFWHLAGNMISLYFLGSYLIRLVGDKRFLVVYFIGGIIGNVLFFFLAHPFSTAIGASGAIAAVCGALVALRPKMRVYMMFIPIPMPLWVFALIFLVILSIIVPGIAWQAHLGGLVTGLIIGYFYRRRLRLLFIE
jgi:membrane associated rhomboid family serine protease